MTPTLYTCSCDGCWACSGHEPDCTCDVDWDAIAEARMDDRVDSGESGRLAVEG
jgi:hypothetical protein